MLYLRGRRKTLSAPSTVAVPPYISGRTSYLRVRLAFHPYPQVIPQFCNTGGFGPRRGLTLASPWPWVAHPVSGLNCATQRPVKTRFRCGSSTLPYLNLAAQINSPDHSSIGTPLAADALPKDCTEHASDCLRVHGFRDSFIALLGCFSPFPHGTCSLSVAKSIEPWRVVPPASHKISRVPWYSRSRS